MFPVKEEKGKVYSWKIRDRKDFNNPIVAETIFSLTFWHVSTFKSSSGVNTGRVESEVV